MIANDELEAITRAYVAEKRGWNLEDYSIENDAKKNEDGNPMVTVVFHGDRVGTSAGSGKSFQIEIDSAKKVVVREFRFQ